jgi:hypothetical protein
MSFIPSVKPKTLFPILFAAALALRLLGNGWGLIDAEALGRAGYEWSGEPASTIFGSHLFDEASFQCLFHYPHDKMALIPLAPSLYSFLTWILTSLGSLGGIFQELWPSPSFVFFHAGRILTAFLSSLALFPVYVISRKIFDRMEIRHRDWVSFLPPLLFAFSPANVAESHFVSYNPVMVLLEMTAFLFILDFCEKIGHLTPGKRSAYAGFLGGWFGVCIAAKWTSLVLVPFYGIALGLLVRLKSHPIKGSVYLQAFWISVLSAVVIYGLIILPALWDAFALKESLQSQAFIISTGSAFAPRDYGRFLLLKQYFSDIFPKGVGVWSYLLGAAGIFYAIKNRRGDWRLLLVLIFTVLYMAAFTSNELGMVTKRNLTVFAAWSILTALGLARLSENFRRPWVFAVLYAGLIFSGLTGSLYVDRFLVRDKMRSDASFQIKQIVPAGEKILLSRRIRRNHIDLTHMDTVVYPDKPHYRFVFQDEAEDLSGFTGYALYPDFITLPLFSSQCAEVLAKFSSRHPARLEPQITRLIGFGSPTDYIRAYNLVLYRVWPCSKETA